MIETNPQHIIETKRLYLRLMNIRDVDQLLLIFSDPEAMKYFNVVFDRKRMENWVNDNLDHQKRYGYSLYSVILRSNDELIGDCGLETDEIEGNKIVGIGYDFRREYWNKGYATEAAAAIRDYGFSHFNFDKLSAWINPENVPSKRVAEKIGMRVESTVLRGGKPYMLYSVLRAGA